MKTANFKRAGWYALLLVVACALNAVAGPVTVTEVKLRAQLIWGTDEPKPKGSQCKEVDPALQKKLGRVFKWKNYFQISEQKTALGSQESKRLKMSSKCEIEFTYIEEATLEVKLYGEGKLTKTIRQPVKALQQGELGVIGGDDKAKYNDAWFVVLSSATD